MIDANKEFKNLRMFRKKRQADAGATVVARFHVLKSEMYQGNSISANFIKFF